MWLNNTITIKEQYFGMQSIFLKTDLLNDVKNILNVIKYDIDV